MNKNTFTSEIIPAEEALKTLLEGNNRFVKNQLESPRTDPEYRQHLTKKQKPFAVILGCSDSRVATEIIFDQGFGDLFVVRVAGNVVSEEVIGSIEFAIYHLNTKLVVVLGHQKCGAVLAAVSGCDHVGCIQSIVDKIKPAVSQVEKTDCSSYDDRCIKQNVKISVDTLKETTPVITDMIKNEGVQIVGAYYHLDSGKVEILD